MKRIVLILGILILPIIGCGLLTDECEIVGIIFESVVQDSEFDDSYLWSYNPTDTFDTDISFKLTTDYESEAWFGRTFSAILFRPNMCFATSKGLDFKNNLDLSTCKLYVDRSFQYDNNEIIANTDLFKQEFISKEILFTEFDYDYPAYVISFSDIFYEKVEFQEEYYNFYFSCSTSDNLQLSDTIKVYLSIKN